jgi:deoxyribonuclease IV
MLIGAHMSVQGGVDRAVERGLIVGCRTMQIFTKNASQWNARPLDREVVRLFRDNLSPSGIAPVVSHGSYLINLASPDRYLRERSIAAFRDELDRAETLGLLGVVTHPGCHMGIGEEKAIVRIGKAIRRLLDRTPRHQVRVILENTAGQGSSLGFKFEHLAEIIAVAGGHPRIGVCLDTCHLHAAGYDLTSDATYRRTFRDFGRIVGLDRLLCFHLNDSKRELGSRVDRHTHIGQGTLGLDAFRRIMTDRRFRRTPKILETPKTGEGIEEDRMNLDTLAGLA